MKKITIQRLMKAEKANLQTKLLINSQSYRKNRWNLLNYKLYKLFYSTVLLNSTKYFTGLSRNAATLLSTKVADIMLVYSKEKSVFPYKDFEIKLSDKEMAGVQYVGGYVLPKLNNKHIQ